MTIGSLSPSPPEELPPPPRGEREDPDRREDGDRSADLRGLLRLPSLLAAAPLEALPGLLAAAPPEALPGLLAAAPPEAFEPAGGRGRATNLIVTLCNSVIVKRNKKVSNR